MSCFERIWRKKKNLTVFKSIRFVLYHFKDAFNKFIYGVKVISDVYPKIILNVKLIVIHYIIFFFSFYLSRANNLIYFILKNGKDNFT